jgi:FAD-dependent urate hydroxylase
MIDSNSTDIVVIGAGPYGLSVASHLKQLGIEFRIFGKPMSAWRDNMPAGMFLKSAFNATSIAAPDDAFSLRDYCIHNDMEPLDDWHPIPIELFVDYGLRFQQRYASNVEHDYVERISRSQTGFCLSLSSGETIFARSIVSASGHMHYVEMPPELRALSELTAGRPLVSHSSEHASFEGFAGRTVAIVGAGQAALESAALLRESGAHVRLVVRNPAVLWGGPPIASDGALRRLIKPATPFGPGWSHMLFTRAPELISFMPPSIRLYLAKNTYGPSGGWWLRQRVEGKIEVDTNTIVEDAAPAGDKVALRLRGKSGESRTTTVDHVIAATGFRVDVDSIGYLDPELRKGIARVPGSGAPRLSRSFESSIPGLYFIGLPSATTFGPLQRFVHGTRFAASSLSRALAPAQGVKPRHRAMVEA